MVICQLGQKRCERKGIILYNQFQPSTIVCIGHVTMGSQNNLLLSRKGHKVRSQLNKACRRKQQIIFSPVNMATNDVCSGFDSLGRVRPCVMYKVKKKKRWSIGATCETLYTTMNQQMSVL
jgi:hypothetical protein